MNRHPKNFLNRMHRTAYFLIGVVTAILMGARVLAQQPAFLTNGLVAYYPFNGNANDESGNGNHGDSIGEIAFTEDRNKVAGQSIGLNGVAGYVRSKTPLNNIQNNFSMSIWFRTDGADREYSGYAVSPSHGLGTWGDRSVGLGISAGTNQIAIWEHTHDHQQKVGYAYGLFQGWNHVCVVYVDRKPSIYVNGEIAFKGVASSYDIVRPSTGYGPLNTALFAFQEGGIGGGKSNGILEIFKGSLDEYRVYNRALSDAEVRSLYQYESVPLDSSFISSGLIAHFPFNGNANDESGNGRNATVYNQANTFLDSDRFGRNNSAYRFENPINGIDPVIWGDGLNLAGKSFSISMWIKGEFSVAKDDYAGINVGAVTPGSPNPGGQQGKSLHWYANSKGMRFSFFYDDFDVAFKPESQKWTHLVATYNAANGLRTLSVNGVLIAQNQAQYGYSGTAIFTFGGRYGTFVDDIRIYQRPLSVVEIKSLFEIESNPPTSHPRFATATAQVVNGFVVGVNITDGGYGYTNNPVVTISGGGGSGAKAVAYQVNGVVASITITNPGSGYTSLPVITIAPPPSPPRKATATAQVVNGFVVGTKIADGGFGYDTAPAVLLIGGGGGGAAATATVANGVVTGITITNPGSGYTSAPIVRIASPPFLPTLGIEVVRVRVKLNVVLGRKYQIEASTDLATWRNAGEAFIAQDEQVLQEFDVEGVGQYFRVNQVP